MTKPVIPNVLAGRYASPAMTTIWSPAHKIVLERQLWVAVLRAQDQLGIDVPTDAIQAYQAVVDQGTDAVDLESIAARERITRHDVKARIEEFAELAGHEQIHKGMTSRDLTENVEQLQIRDALGLIRTKTLAVLSRLARRAGRVRLPGDGRPFAQRRGPGDDAGQAVRDGGRRAARRARAAR